MQEVEVSGNEVDPVEWIALRYNYLWHDEINDTQFSGQELDRNKLMENAESCWPTYVAH